MYHTSFSKQPIRAIYMCNFEHFNCHPGVCITAVTVYEARYPLMVHCSFALTLPSVKQDTNCKGQSCMCKQPFMLPQHSVL